MLKDLLLPALGENIEVVEVVKLLISEGDMVIDGQPVLELETGKATLEIPSTISGVVKKVHVSEGDEIQIAQALFTIESDHETEIQSVPEKIVEETQSFVTEASLTQTTPVKTRSIVSEFMLPSLGENIESIEIINVMVKVGDKIAVGQGVLELESDKATVEVPSSVEGIVTDVRVKVGALIKAGEVVFAFESFVASSLTIVSRDSDISQQKKESISPCIASDETPVPLLPSSSFSVPASPTARKFAREIGIEIREISGSGPHGRISIDDIKHHSKQLNDRRINPRQEQISTRPPLKFEKWGNVYHKRMSGIRYKTAQHMALSWSQIPQVTIFDEGDVTQLEELRACHSKKAKVVGGKLTISTVLVKIVSQALRVHKNFNASIDMDRKEIIHKEYCNIGVAVDTNRGLLVPVIRNADEKSIMEISVELFNLVEKARSGKVTREEIEGGTFSITNLGRTGGKFFTPIVNYPEVAILGIGCMFLEPNFKGDVQKKLPFSLSFDHRIIDGAESTRFLRWIIDALDDPALLSLDGEHDRQYLDN